MKQLLIVAGLGLSLTGCMTAADWSEAPLSASDYGSEAPVGWWGRDVPTVDLFYRPLSGYGQWGAHPRYGRVFLPGGIGGGWQPYSRGYWRNDRYGRRWISSEPFGWATYHYGRWGRDSRFGWFWVPDTRFGPGWVDWRDGGGYASWSPLPPMGWDRWGGSWGNDWWIHAPLGWIYRPGLYGHVNRGRHDWGRGWNGRYDRPGGWDGRPDRPGGWDGRPDRPRGESPRPPRSPVRIPEGAHPGSDPAWVGGQRQPSAEPLVRGERQPARQGWVRGERPGFERGERPRSPVGVRSEGVPIRPEVVTAPSAPAAIRSQPRQAEARQIESRPIEAPAVQQREVPAPVQVEAPRGSPARGFPGSMRPGGREGSDVHRDD